MKRLSIIYASFAASVFMSAPMPLSAAGATGAEPALASTQLASGLSLEAALQRTLTQSPSLAVARGALGAADAARIQAALWPNPELELEIEGSDAPSREVAVLLSQPLELGGQRAARIAVADQTKQLAQAQYALALATTRAQVIQAFAQTMTVQEQVDQAKSSLGLAEKALNATAKRVEAGSISPVEETRARLAAATARSQLHKAQGQLQAARLQLAALWGASAPDFAQVEGELGSLPALPALPALEQQLDALPRLQLARHDLERLKALAQLERTRRIPLVTVTAGARRIGEADETIPVIGVSLPLPLFDRNQGNVLEAQRRVAMAQDQLALERVQAREALGLAYSRFKMAQDEAELIRDQILPGAESAYEASVRGFELGKFSLLDVLDVQRTLYQARDQYVQALAEAHEAYATIESIRGTSVLQPDLMSK